MKQRQNFGRNLSDTKFKNSVPRMEIKFYGRDLNFAIKFHCTES